MVNYLKEDVTKYKFRKSSLICSFYTLQFIHPEFRQLLMNNIYESLNWGGVLLIFEKIRGNDARFQDMMTYNYNMFKLNNGFKADEIINKSLSLSGVLEPFSSKGNLDLMKRAGFEDIQNIFRYNCFGGWCAIK